MKFCQAYLYFEIKLDFKLALKASTNSSLMSGSSEFHTLTPEKPYMEYLIISSYKCVFSR